MSPRHRNRGPETVIKAILISVGFLICLAVLQPVPEAALSHEITIDDFTVISEDYELALEVSDLVPGYVKDITKTWLPEKIPAGMRHTTIHVRIRPYNRAYCSLDRQIYITSNRDHLEQTLKHELTHALLIIRYPDLPRWTHEGIATHWDGPKKQKVFSSVLNWSRRAGTYPRLEEIMQGVRFNSRNHAAYSASNSLVKFLLSKNDRYTLFLYSTDRCTLERAYGFSTIQDLQQAWVRWLNEPRIAGKP